MEVDHGTYQLSQGAFLPAAVTHLRPVLPNETKGPHLHVTWLPHNHVDNIVDKGEKLGNEIFLCALYLQFT